MHLMHLIKKTPPTATVIAAALLAGCGSGGGGDGPPGSPVGSVSGQYAQQCAPDNPYRQDSDVGPQTGPGSLAVEKQWVREYVNEAYLWYARIPTLDASAAKYSQATAAGHYPSLDTYFIDLTTNPDDRFSFTYPTASWKLLSQAGVALGYGAEFARVAGAGSGAYRIAFVEPGGPAAVAGLRRGDTLAAINGTPVASLSSAAIDAALLPTTAVSYDFSFVRNGSANVLARLTAGNVALSPVPATAIVDTSSGRVGYMLFNDHVLTAEVPLANAFSAFRTQGVNDLVIDLRYNRGGYLYLASQVGNMVTGSARTAAKIFERRQYSDKRAAESNSTSSITPFFNAQCLPDTRQGFVCTSTASLPELNLSRVWILASSDTCSASEALINALRGIDVSVHLIGSPTCGKPYGFTAKDNCGISYFPIEYKGVNGKGFGDYATGFAPTCTASDDFDHTLGDPSERLLALALGHRATGTCVPSGAAKPDAAAQTSRLLPRPERSLKIDQPLSGMVR